MFEATFQDLFRAVDRIEQGLIKSDQQQREILSEELSLLRSACDQYMEKWLQFEEKVFELCERYDLQIDAPAAHLPLNTTGPANAKQNPISPQSQFPVMEEAYEQEIDQQFVLPSMANSEAAQLFRTGLGYFDLLLFDQSIEQMEQVLLLNPDLMVTRIYLALAYLAKGEHEKCESHLQFVSILEQDPLLLAASASAKAQIAAAQGNYEQAICLFEQALEHEPQLKDIHYNLGVCEWHRKNYKDAIGYLRLAVEIEPGDWQSFQLMARCLLRLGRLQHAVEALETARKLNPAYPPLLLNLADVYQRIGRLPEAKSIYERLVDTDPDSAPALGGLGWVYLQEGQYEAALTCFERQKLTDLTAESLYNLGCVYLALGRLQYAKTHFDLIEDDPRLQPLAHFASARLCIQEKKYEAAKKRVAVYLNDPNRELRALAYLTLGRVAYEESQWKSAVRYLKLCSMLKPELPDCAFWLGASLQQLGQEQESQKWLLHCRRLMSRDQTNSLLVTREKATTAMLKDV